MHRIESALLQNRCVFVLGDGLINAKSQVELSKRNIPAVSITGETLDGIHPFSKEAFAPATEKNGVVVLVDPSLSEEHIDELATLLKESNPRPQIFIVSKAYNRFSLPMVMLGWKLHQLKYNGLPFLRALKAPSKNQSGGHWF